MATKLTSTLKLAIIELKEGLECTRRAADDLRKVSMDSTLDNIIDDGDIFDVTTDCDIASDGINNAIDDINKLIKQVEKNGNRIFK